MTVASKVFNQVIARETGLLSNSTVVMVTNQLQWLPRADHIIILGEKGPNGSIKSGTDCWNWCRWWAG